MKRIITEHVKPPIPIRQFDWCAWRDGDEEDGLRGYGKSELIAINDLIQQERDQ